MAETSEHRAPGPLSRYRALLATMRSDARRAPALAWRRFRHEIVVRHRSSLLALPLAFAPALIVTLWATLASRAKILTVHSVPIPYPAWVLISVVLWQTFAEALTAQVEGLEQERRLLAKVDLPAEAIILERFAGVLFQLLLKLVLGLAVVVLFQIHLPGVAWALPLLALPLAALGTAIGLWVAPFAALYPDLGRAVPAITTVGFFLTPVVFAVPDAGAFRWLLLANPVTPLLGWARDLAVAGVVSHPVGATASAILVVVLLPTGWFLYRMALPYVLDQSNG